MSIAARFAVLLIAASALLAASGTAVAEQAVSVSLHTPFAITANPSSVAAGSVIFQVSNDDLLIHNLRVIKTDLPPAGLPVVAFQVDKTQVNVVASTSDLLATQNENTPAVILATGNYVLICNIASHYTAGMFLAFQVTQAVGGIAELPDAAGTPLEATGTSSDNAGVVASVAAAAIAGVVALGGAAWYTRRRWLR